MESGQARFVQSRALLSREEGAGAVTSSVKALEEGVVAVEVSRREAMGMAGLDPLRAAEDSVGVGAAVVATIADSSRTLGQSSPHCSVRFQ